VGTPDYRSCPQPTQPLDLRSLPAAQSLSTVDSLGEHSTFPCSELFRGQPHSRRENLGHPDRRQRERRCSSMQSPSACVAAPSLLCQSDFGGKRSWPEWGRIVRGAYSRESGRGRRLPAVRFLQNWRIDSETLTTARGRSPPPTARPRR